MSEIETLVKICSGCREPKDLTNFTKNASSPDGHYSICRSCKSIKTRKHLPDSQGNLRCYVCQEWKSLEAYARATGKGRATCTGCSKERKAFLRKSKEIKDPSLREARIEKAKAKYHEDVEVSRLKARLKVYSLSEEEYFTLLVAQEGICALCLNERPLVIDHDHRTGKVRGLLCRSCNGSLGVLEKITLGRLEVYLSGGA